MTNFEKRMKELAGIRPSREQINEISLKYSPLERELHRLANAKTQPDIIALSDTGEIMIADNPFVDPDVADEPDKDKTNEDQETSSSVPQSNPVIADQFRKRMQKLANVKVEEGEKFVPSENPIGKENPLDLAPKPPKKEPKYVVGYHDVAEDPIHTNEPLQRTNTQRWKEYTPPKYRARKFAVYPPKPPEEKVDEEISDAELGILQAIRKATKDEFGKEADVISYQTSPKHKLDFHYNDESKMYYDDEEIDENVSDPELEGKTPEEKLAILMKRAGTHMPAAGTQKGAGEKFYQLPAYKKAIEKGEEKRGRGIAPTPKAKPLGGKPEEKDRPIHPTTGLPI